MTRDITSGLAEMQREHGIIRPAMLVEHYDITPSNASMRLRNMTKRGELEKVAHGQYRLPDDVPGEAPRNPAPRAAVVNAQKLIGIPHVDRDHVELIKIAIVSLLEAGKKLVNVLDDADEGSALEETLTGMLREQSRQAAMLRLMLEDIDAY